MKIDKLFLLYVNTDTDHPLDSERYVAFITNKGVGRCKEKAKELWNEWSGEKMTEEEWEETFEIIDINSIEIEI